MSNISGSVDQKVHFCISYSCVGWPSIWKVYIVSDNKMY